LPEGFSAPEFCFPGILAIKSPRFEAEVPARAQVEALCRHLENFDLQHIPMILLVDDSAFTAATLNNFVWVAFTRANPSHDVHGVQAFIEHKHWGCRGPMVLDARIKPHHAPELVVDPEVQKRAKTLLEGYGLG
jgi:4-hydroxy-3-polyprenylbenzoate decarboxylase